MKIEISPDYQYMAKELFDIPRMFDEEQGEIVYSGRNVVRRFLTEIFQNGELEQWSDYVAEDLIQHNHEIGQGSDAYKNYVAEHGVTFDFVFQLLGQGNYVVSYGQNQIDGVAYAQYDIFRLENGLIVEHWDNKEVMPKVEDLTNRGKF